MQPFVYTHTLPLTAGWLTADNLSCMGGYPAPCIFNIGQAFFSLFFVMLPKVVYNSCEISHEIVDIIVKEKMVNNKSFPSMVWFCQ